MSMSLEVASVREQLAALEDERARAINERHGDSFGVNLTKLRAIAKACGANTPLALELWATGDTAMRLVAILVMRPREVSIEQLDAMLREANGPKVRDWLVNYVVKKHKQREDLRLSWFSDPDQYVAAAGWGLTWDRVGKQPDGIDLEALLDQIDAEMVAAPDALQWAMNGTLAQIGISHPSLRDRALEMGERLGVLRDYPVSKGCTSPFAPIWINEIVSRQESAAR